MSQSICYFPHYTGKINYIFTVLKLNIQKCLLNAFFQIYEKSCPPCQRKLKNDYKNCFPKLPSDQNVR